MAHESMTLLEAIGRHSHEPLLIVEDTEYSAKSLINIAESLRSDYPSLEGADVALHFSRPGAFLTHLIALDGFASKILLLPPCMEDGPRESILSDGGFSVLIGDDGLQESPSSHSRAPFEVETQWLFTTSGTSGTPRVFSHTLRTLSLTAKTSSTSAMSYRWGLTYQPHRFAGVQVIVQALLSGSPLVIPGDTDLAGQLIQFAKHGVNCLSATPSQWRLYLIQGSIGDCPLKQITLGGEIADQAILTALKKAFPKARIVHVYASTEAGVGFSVTDGMAGFPSAWLGEGPPAAMRISEDGHLLIRSAATSTSGSLKARTTSDNYLDTEDCVSLDADRVYFAGRASGIINVGGNKVFPEEVENIIKELPEVQNAIVGSRSSPIMGELLTLSVQVADDSRENKAALKKAIFAHCRSRLQKHKIPAIIKFSDNLTLSDAGKVDRKNPA
jgi:acyl-CoA synthetase (AMP-forming)/AMP-acid ligase II